MLSPTTAGSYILDEVLGRGGMGVVYAARQTSLGRSVALKLMNSEFATDPSLVERFRIEGIAAGRVEHPNVVYVIDRGTTEEGQPYLVMERVGGERLGAIVECAGRLAPRRAGRLVLQVLAALEATHHAGVIHADVKCDNLLVDTTGDAEHVTLIDFGIARLTDRANPCNDTDRGERMLSGTPEYLAPELISGAQPTIASDLYAVGIVLYELLTGSPPFQGGTAAATFQQHLDEDAVPPSLRCPEAQISPALDRILVHALAKDPTKRFSSAAAFATALRAALPATEIDVQPSAAPGFSTESPTQDWPSAPRRRLADGTTPRPTGDHLRALRAAVGTAILDGDREEIASAYLELARAYVSERRADRAAAELEQGIDVITAGGAHDEAPPEGLWRLELALATIYDDLGDAGRARLTATRARRDAIRAHSTLGRDRARVLLRRLVHEVAS